MTRELIGLSGFCIAVPLLVAWFKLWLWRRT